MHDIVLYRNDGACSMIPHITLKELGIPFTSKAVKITPGVGIDGTKDGSLTRADYLKLQPDGYVPALSVDGAALTEAPAILSYIAELAPDRHFMGKTAWERAKAAEWLAWLSGSLHGTGFAGLWRPLRFSNDESVFVAIQDKAREKIDAGLERIESRLEGKQWAVGDSITVVDIYLHTVWRWLQRIGTEHANAVKGYPNLARIMKKVEQLESVIEIMAVENQPLTFV
jgi:glutathione S-transferase